MGASQPIPSEVNIGGTGYRVQVSPEGLIVFSEADPVWSQRSRIAFHRDEPNGCWYVDTGHSEGDSVMADHVVRAYRLVCEWFGANFEEKMPGLAIVPP
jgi:hypothetical protein